MSELSSEPSHGLPGAWWTVPDVLCEPVNGRPRIVCICGSTRFRDDMADANRRLTLAGAIVVAPAVFQHKGDLMTELQKTGLDTLHLSKIDLADAVLVVDPGGYIGESTTREIAYTESKGKPIVRLSVLVGAD